MKPTHLLSCLLALALTSVVSAEEPGRPPEGVRPPERREEGDRDKPRERGPETEVRKGEPAWEEGKRPEGRGDEGRPKGPQGPGGEMHRGAEGHRPPHDGRGGPDGPDKKPEMHKERGGEMREGRGEDDHGRPGRPEGREGHDKGRGHEGGPQAFHVMEAIKHLHAAGMHEVASLLEARAKGPGHPGRPGRPEMGMRHPRMMKPPFANAGRPGPGEQGREMHRGPRPEGDKRPEGRPEGGPQRG